MLKGNLKFIIILLLCLSTLIMLQITAPKPIDWNLSYQKKDKIPYGTAALYNSLPAIFPSQIITEKNIPLYNVLKPDIFQRTNYIIINERFSPDSLDIRELLKFVKAGNNAFIAANNFGGPFADTLKLETNNNYELENFSNVDSATVKSFTNQKSESTINFVSPYLKIKNAYIYKKGFQNNYFSSFDSARTIILGITNAHQVNFIKIQFGSGSFYLNSAPEAFTNYHFVSTNHDYVFKALSYLPITDVIWDEYYKIGYASNENPLHVIFSNAALKYAYYLFLISLLVFVLIGIKRKQRIIPVIDPLRNTTLEFVNIVGALYYQTGNHKNIAEKKITYFLEYIRNAFQVKTAEYDDVFLLRISNLSGIDYQSIHNLFYYFSDISLKQTISQQELLKLNQMIEEFHHLNKR